MPHLSIFLVVACFELASSSIRLTVLHQSQLPESSTLLRGDDYPIPIGGNYEHDGEYFLNVTIGDELFTLLIDTGSSDLGLAAVGCNGCTKKYHHYYDPSSSASPLGCEFCQENKTRETDLRCLKRPREKEKQCTYRVSYADGSGFSAALYEDDFTFDPSLKKIRASIGAMYSANFPNPRSVDGIIGFADLSEASSGATNPYLKLVESQLIDDVFSLCLTTNGGVLYLGYESFLEDTEIVWTSRAPHSGFYAIQLDDVKVNNTSIGVSPKFFNDGTAIVDSGTSDTCFSSTAFKAIKSQFEDMCRTTCLKGICNCETKTPLREPIFESRCVHMTQQDIDLFPEIEMTMKDGAIVKYSPQAYLRSGDVMGCEDDTQYTIALSSSGPDGSGTILGDSFMMQYVVVHDRRQTPQRIGFLPIGDEKCP